MQPLKIAYLGSSTALDGGSELCLLAMATHFNAIHEVTLFLPDRGPLFQEAQARGIPVISLDFLRLRRYRGMDWWHWIRSVRRASWLLDQALEDLKIDLVHFNDFIDLPFYRVAAGRGIPSLSHLRLITSRWPAQIFRTWAAWNGIHVLAVSKAVRRMMLNDRYGEVLYDPGPDSRTFTHKPEDRQAFRESRGWQKHHVVIGMVSKLLENKGHRNFIRLAHRLQQSQAISNGKGVAPDRYRFLMVAGPSPGRDSFREEIAREVATFPTGTFTWLPGQPHDDIARTLNACDLFVHLPDTEDSFPGVVLEAMACGVPVVAYDRGGIHEQLADGKAGILVKPGNLDELAQGIRSLGDNPEQREALARAGKQRIEQEFSPEKHFQALDAIYHRLVQGKK